MFTGHAERPDIPRTIEPGQPGDLCVLAAAPADVLDVLDAELVTASVVGGDVRVSSSRS